MPSSKYQRSYKEQDFGREAGTAQRYCGVCCCPSPLCISDDGRHRKHAGAWLMKKRIERPAKIIVFFKFVYSARNTDEPCP